MVVYKMYNGFYGWDDAKNELNIKNHGFDFWTAIRVFDDPNYLLEEDRVDETTREQRWNAWGLVNGKVLITTHAYRPKPENAETTFTHIISSRDAERWEERRYYKQID